MLETSSTGQGRAFHGPAAGQEGDDVTAASRSLDYALPAMHPNEALLRQEYAARAAHDDRGLAALFGEEVVWHVPGRSAIAGDYRGIDEVMG